MPRKTNRSYILHRGIGKVEKKATYEELNLKLLELLSDCWDRVISLDFETYVVENRFLNDEKILSVSFARRVSGKTMQAEGIEVKSNVLNKEDKDSEKQMLDWLDEELGKINPLGVVGYMLRAYDIPLLIMKKERNKVEGSPYWKIIDLTENAVHVDLYHLLRDRGYNNLYDAISSLSQNLPLKKVEDYLSQNREMKGKAVKELWEKGALKEYNEGHAYNMLLIAEWLTFGGE
ncbi:MAG: ribonuclease H-like domain-containing protein [Candidatus Caldarchaeum sp.]|jgi:DNA polymerase elongation subunit (family B)